MLIAVQAGWAQPEDAEACKGRHSQTAETAVNQAVQVSVAEALIQLAPGSRGHCCRMSSSLTDAAQACSAPCGMSYACSIGAPVHGSRQSRG